MPDVSQCVAAREAQAARGFRARGQDTRECPLSRPQARPRRLVDPPSGVRVVQRGQALTGASQGLQQALRSGLALPGVPRQTPPPPGGTSPFENGEPLKPFISSDDENPGAENLSVHTTIGSRVGFTSRRYVHWAVLPQTEVQELWEWLGVWLRMQGDRSKERRCYARASDDSTRCVLVRHPASVEHYYEPHPPRETESPGAV